MALEIEPFTKTHTVTATKSRSKKKKKKSKRPVKTPKTVDSRPDSATAFKPLATDTTEPVLDAHGKVPEASRGKRRRK